MLIHRRTRRTQPQTPTGVDWNNPLSAGCLYLSATTSNTPFDSRSGRPSTASGTPTNGVGNFGRALELAAGSDAALIGACNVVLPSARVTIAVVRQKKDATLRFCTLFGYDTRNSGLDRVLAHAPFGDGNIYWDFGDANTGRLVVSGQTWGTGIDRMCFIAGPVKGREVWRNGLRIGNNASTFVRGTLSSEQFSIGSASGSGSDSEYIYFFGIFDAEWTDAQIASWTANPWQLFTPTQRRVWAAALSTGIDLACGAQSVATVSAALTTSIRLASAPQAQATVTPALTTSVRLASASTATATANAALTAQISLTVAAQAQAASTSALTTTVKLAADASAIAACSAALTTAPAGFAAAAQTQATATAALSASIRLAASAAAQVSATAALSTSPNGLTAAAQAIASAPAALSTNLTLQAVALAQATSAASLDAAIRLTTQAIAQASSSAALTSSTGFASAAAALASSTASLSTAIRLAAAATSTATANAAVNDAVVSVLARYTITAAARDLTLTSSRRRLTLTGL